MAKPFSIARSIMITAAPTRVHALINNFHHWLAWSPWEGMDPALERTYAGPDAGTGASYTWQGTRKAGAGTMKITSSTPDQIEIDLAFIKPFRSKQKATFFLTLVGDDHTEVRWQIDAMLKPMMAIIDTFTSLEAMIAPDLELGLTQLKAAAES